MSGRMTIAVLLLATLGCSSSSKPTTVEPTSDLEERKTDKTPCVAHEECRSRVCDHIKAEMGICAPSTCLVGSRSDNNHFFCGDDARWLPSKEEGEPCAHDFECFEPTCFMNPNCEQSTVSRTHVACRDGVCVRWVDQDPCEASGMVRVLAKEEMVVTDDGRCAQSLEQRALRTVCAPCGNGTCERELESRCNCPEDCGD